MRVVIWHNPRCRKSREALQWLRHRGITPEVREYLKQPPQPDELSKVLSLLGLRAEELLRKQEKEYKELVRGKGLSEQALIETMCAHPRLIERPIVIVDDERAVLARPAERLEALF